MKAWAWPFWIAAALTACSQPPVGGPPGIPFDQVTLANVVRWPDGRDYITVVGRGYPGDGQKEQKLRRDTAQNAAALAAQEKLIDQLKRLVDHAKIPGLLRQVDVAKVDFSYDDICTLTLRLPNDLLSGKPRNWTDDQ